jgi:hypothetical protein
MLITSRKPAQVIPATAVFIPAACFGRGAVPAREELVFKGFAAWAPLWIQKHVDI